LQNQNAPDEFRDRPERRLRRFAMRRMSDGRNHRHVDRTIALLLRDLDLSNGSILVIGALQDCDRHAYVGEVLRNIPAAKPGVEPGLAPAVEGVVDIAVPALELRLEAAGLVGLPGVRDRPDPDILDDE